MVENASRRFKCVWLRQNRPPTSAVTTPAPRRMARTPASCGPNAEANRAQYSRATAYTPSSTITPENSTHTGVGATAWASASQKWKGTTEALIRNPAASSTNAVTTRPSSGCELMARPIWAKLSAPVRPYSSARPHTIRYAPMVLTMAKLSAPCSGPFSSIR
jgi:hypothetical protein